MRNGSVTTPFGRRPAKLALVKAQLHAAETKPNKPIGKWQVFRDACEAREHLGLQDRALAVLDALLSFYPNDELSEEDGLIVFPSNRQLSLRAHGIAGTTLRRHLAALVDAGLIQRRDSPNGKRYVHRDGEGEIERAYGFDLTPLLTRAAELAGLAQEVVAERRRHKLAREALTICRRDVRKLLSAVIEDGTDGDWTSIEARYIAILTALPRNPSRSKVEAALDEMSLLRSEIVSCLENQLKTENTDGNDSQNERHIQNSKSESIYEFEPSSRKEQGAAVATKSRPTQPALKSFPLGLVLQACPQISDYSRDGRIVSWRELMGAAVVVRSMLGVSPSAYEDACVAMGQENAATAIACILERAEHINSPGGYLRDLTRRAERDEFSLGPMLMALLRNSSGSQRRSAS